MEDNNYFWYHIFANILKFLGNIYFGGRVINKNNIPENGRCILAGNHVSNYDSYLLFKSTKRPIHIIAKKELFASKFRWFFKKMHLIPVDRTKKNPEAKEEAINILNANKVLGIFPEGTFHKKELLLPFKPGAVSFALKTNAPIIPFAIKGKFTFRGHPTIVFGNPIYLDKIDAQDKVLYLENVVKELLTK